MSRRLDDWWEVVGLLGWKSAQLAVGWWAGYDSMAPEALDVGDSRS